MGFLKDRRFRFGGYAATITVAVVVIVLLFNIGISALETNFGLKIDLSGNQMFTLSDYSKKVLTDLDQDVKIYTYYAVGNKDDNTGQLLQRYFAVSHRVKIENIDPMQNPQFGQKFLSGTHYTVFPSNGIVVCSMDETRYKLMSADELNIYSSEDPTFAAETEGEPSLPHVTAYQGERKITAAILEVTSPIKPNVYILQGHKEKTKSTMLSLVTLLQERNYNVQDLSLITSEKKLKKGDFVMVVAPKTDLTKDELAYLATFMNEGGKILLFLGSESIGLPNFNELLKLYFLNMQDVWVLEGDPQNYFRTQGDIIAQMVGENSITGSLIIRQLQVVLSNVRPIKDMVVTYPGTVITPILETSAKSYGKQNFGATDLRQANEDTKGPFKIGLIVEKSEPTNAKNVSYLATYGSASLVLGNEYESSGNLDVVLNTFSWMSQDKEELPILERKYATQVKQLTSQEKNILAVCITGIVPLLIGIAGFVVWRRRRYL